MKILENIQMVDLVSQYQNIQTEINQAMAEVLDSAWYIKGPVVQGFEKALAEYTESKHVISCANGTDALQVALMALELKPGDEVIVPAFTYVATAEVIALLGLSPVMVDIDLDTFNTTAEIIEAAITDKTKAIVPVHLFGQSSDMEDIMTVANKHNLYVIEDNAQAIGADYFISGGESKKTGTIGHIGTTSFFPSKNLGCYGDGGAIFTQDDDLQRKISVIADHGQTKKYYHTLIGVNSRLDALQAAVLNVKLKYLDMYCDRRRAVANKYDQSFKNIDALQSPFRADYSSHVFHQYTLRVKDGQRDKLKQYLLKNKIPSMVYYPVPLYKQEAYAHYWNKGEVLPNTEQLCSEVISLPIHTEMKTEVQNYIIDSVNRFFD